MDILIREIILVFAMTCILMYKYKSAHTYVCMYIVELGRDVCMYVTGALNDNLSSMAPNTVNSYIKLNINEVYNDHRLKICKLYRNIIVLSHRITSQKGE